MSSTTSDEVVRPSHAPAAVNPFARYEEEFDLLELISIIFNRKFTVLAIAFVAVLAGVAVSYMLPQRWTSSAILVPADAPQLRSMDKVLNELAILDVKTEITPDTLLSDFMRNFDSRSLREKYLVNTNYFKELSKDKTDNAETRNRLINSILNGNIDSHSSIQDKDNDKKEYRYYEIKYSAETPTAARDLLEGYINYVTSIAVTELHQNLNYQVEMLRSKAVALYNLDMMRAETSHRLKIERLQYALDIANSAGLKKPSWSNGANIQDDPDFSVTLGADGLARKLQIEKSLTDAAQLDDKLQNRRLYIQKLDQLKVDEMDVQPFKYMRAPYEPIKRDEPKRVLVVVLFALAGLLAGCGYVVINSLMQRRRTLDGTSHRVN